MSPDHSPAGYPARPIPTRPTRRAATVLVFGLVAILVAMLATHLAAVLL